MTREPPPINHAARADVDDDVDPLIANAAELLRACKGAHFALSIAYKNNPGTIESVTLADLADVIAKAEGRV